MAVRFDASTDSLSRTTSLPSITSFTIMGWFKISVDRDANSTFFQFGHATTDADYQVLTSTDGTTLEVFPGIDGEPPVTGSALTVGEWYHIALTVSGTGAGQVLCYLNGVLDITQEGNPGNTAGKIFIGIDEGTAFLNGCAAAIKIYGAVLTAAEIANERRCYMPIRTANLNSWYPLLSTADDEVDYSGAGLTLTVGGTLATEDGPPIPWRVGTSRVYIPAVVAGSSSVSPSVSPSVSSSVSPSVSPSISLSPSASASSSVSLSVSASVSPTPSSSVSASASPSSAGSVLVARVVFDYEDD